MLIVILIASTIPLSSTQVISPHKQVKLETSNASQAGLGNLYQTLYLTSVNSTSPVFKTPVWQLSFVPQIKNATAKTTEIFNGGALLVPITYNGYYILQPGISYTANTSGNSSYPMASYDYAYGWLYESGGTAYKIPSGVWKFSSNVTVIDNANTSGGPVQLGVAVFIYNITTENFTPAFHILNKTVNLLVTGNHEFGVNLSSNEGSLSVSSDDRLFAEYYLYVDNASLTSGSLNITFDVGGKGGADYNMSFPYFGWIAGTVYPHYAKISIDGVNVVANGGMFNISASPSYYTLTVSAPYYNKSYESIEVFSGKTTEVSITLHRLYVLWFNETGLPGKKWGVYLDGINNTTSGSSISFLVPNGTYNYSVITAKGYGGSPSSGIISVNGHNSSIAINFTELKYPVFIKTEGLNNSTWGVQIGNERYNISASNFTLYLYSGNYSYNITPPVGYAVSTQSGVLHLDYMPAYINLTFIQLKYRVVFFAYGLPVGVQWFVVINGNRYYSNSSTLMLYLPYEFYNYTVGSAGKYRPVSANGTLNVSGNTEIITRFGPVSSGFFFGIPILFLLILVLVASVEFVASFFYFNRRKKAETGENRAGAVGKDENGVNGLREGYVYAFSEERPEKSRKIFEAGIRAGYRGLCFTREYPGKLLQKYDISKAELIWLTSAGGDNALRPKDLEKISLVCNEFLSAGKSIIMIDGLEYLVSNNNFLTVLKLIQYLRDEVAIRNSILLLSFNPKALGENELNYLVKEIDEFFS